MVCPECPQFAGGKCMASSEMNECDAASDNPEDCLRYRLFYLRGNIMQLK